MTPKITGWQVYVLECGDGSLYTGSTNDLKKRLIAHSAGTGAKYTRSHRPIGVVYTENCADRSIALKREAEIKKLTRQQKLKLIS
ncbi:MAG TPA: endonuclease [Candidatus Pacebacteria bacterium]|nr:endonuclease [Candidatus Paceibacterota bacterium]